MQTTTGGGASGGQGTLSWSVTGREGPAAIGPGVLALGPGSIGVAEPMIGIADEGVPPTPAPSAQVATATAMRVSRASGSPDPRMYDRLDGQAIEPAVQYVQKIKQRCDAETYKQFLEILSKYHQQPDTIDEVSSRSQCLSPVLFSFYFINLQKEVHVQISRLFKDAPDLRSDFRVFMMPEGSMFEEADDMSFDAPGPSERRSGRVSTPILDKAANSKRIKDKVEALPQSVPLKRKRKPEKEKEREKEVSSGKAMTSNKVIPFPLSRGQRFFNVNLLRQRRPSKTCPLLYRTQNTPPENHHLVDRTINHIRLIKAAMAIYLITPHLLQCPPLSLQTTRLYFSTVSSALLTHVKHTTNFLNW